MGTSSTAAAPAANALLSVENISLHFGGVRALTEVSFDVCEGELLSIIGPNGAGKSSLLNCINGVYWPQAGVVRFQGQPLDRENPPDDRPRGPLGGHDERRRPDARGQLVLPGEGSAGEGLEPRLLLGPSSRRLESKACCEGRPGRAPHRTPRSAGVQVPTLVSRCSICRLQASGDDGG